MIELNHDELAIHFPEVHEKARIEINCQRTLRIPDDGGTYPLPAGLGKFPLRHVDDHARTVPGLWIEHGGVMLPMYQAEALWICFNGWYPFAIKIAAGKINAVTGEEWRDGLHRDPQDYLVTPGQPWLDGYCVERGVIRQFVAMPLGQGYTAEEQITGRGVVGGLQIVAYPLKREAFERSPRRVALPELSLSSVGATGHAMGLAPGGRMRQEIYRDHHALEDWDQRHRARCFVPSPMRRSGGRSQARLHPPSRSRQRIIGKPESPGSTTTRRISLASKGLASYNGSRAWWRWGRPNARRPFRRTIQS